MALVLGTSSGFVTEAPTADPEGGSTTTADGKAAVTADTSPAGNNIVIEMGWYDNTAGTEEANFEVGLYAADGAVAPGEAGTLLEVSRTNAKGTSAGWHTVTGLNWVLSSTTDYWLGLQLDDTSTSTGNDRETSGGSGYDALSSQTTLPNPFGGGALSDTDGMYAIYALIEAIPSDSGFGQQGLYVY